MVLLAISTLEGNGPHTARSFNEKAHEVHAVSGQPVLVLDHVPQSRIDEMVSISLDLQDPQDLVVREQVGHEGHFYGVRLLPDKKVLILDASVGVPLETDTEHFWGLVEDAGKDIDIFQLLDYDEEEMSDIFDNCEEAYDLPGGADQSCSAENAGKLIMDASWECATATEQEKQYLLGLLVRAGVNPDVDSFIFEARHALSPIRQWKDACMPTTFQHLGIPCDVRRDGPFPLLEGLRFLLQCGFFMAPARVCFVGQYALIFEGHMMALVVGRRCATLFNGHWSMKLFHSELRQLLTRVRFDRTLGIFARRHAGVDYEALLWANQPVECTSPFLPGLVGASNVESPVQATNDPALLQLRHLKGSHYLSAAQCSHIPVVWQDRFFVCGLLALAGYNPGDFRFDICLEHARSQQRLLQNLCGVSSLCHLGWPVQALRSGPYTLQECNNMIAHYGVMLVGMVVEGGGLVSGEYVFTYGGHAWAVVVAGQQALIANGYWKVPCTRNTILNIVRALPVGVHKVVVASNGVHTYLEDAGDYGGYANLRAFRRCVVAGSFDTRTEYLEKIKFNSIDDPSPFPQHYSTICLLFAMEVQLVPKEYKCHSCNAAFSIKGRQRQDGEYQWQWRGPRYENGCAHCNDKVVSMTKNTLLESVRISKWGDFLDVLIMWLQEYPKLIMLRESGLHHSTLEEWCDLFTDKAGEFFNENVTFESYYQQHRRSETRRRAAARQHGRRFVPKPIILEADESFLNRGKRTHLIGNVRPQRDKLWLWGCTVADKPELSFFRVLDHPDDAYDGRPRGKAELMCCFNMVGLNKNMVVVTDSWRGSIAALCL